MYPFLARINISQEI